MVVPSELLIVNDDLEIRLARPEDADEIFGLPSAPPFLPEWKTLDELIDIVERSSLRSDFASTAPTFFWVVRDRHSSELVGWYRASISTRETREAGHEGVVATLDAAYVRSERRSTEERKTHVARAIGARIEELLRAHGVEWALAKVRDKNAPAIKALLARGFEPGPRFGIMPDDGEFEHSLWKRLD